MTASYGLQALFRQYGTDKVGYAPAYEIFLRPRQHRVAMVLEVGIGTLIPTAHSNMVGWAAPHYRPGGSLRAWRDYFPQAQIIGIDVQPDTQFSEHRVSTYLCDSTNREAVGGLVRQLNLHDVDLIVDDGSHRGQDQLATLQNLFHLLAADGLYVIEDVVGTGFHDLRDEIRATVGTSVLLSVGLEYNPIFIQKVA